ncbi:hypothetical protein DAA48_21415 [Aeromonas veronii]|uniref:Uncharacterized protein n=2 Tax=Aeromonas veronii TaxID=654 RepID=A0A2T4MWN3_AERVE|nr:hypothetical protein DAA48_21415 [Aeromonas veronii]
MYKIMLGVAFFFVIISASKTRGFSMIAVITCTENELDRWGYPTGRKVQIVSHGVNIHTLENVVLPPVSIEEIGAIYNPEVGSYVLPPNEHVARPARSPQAVSRQGRTAVPEVPVPF